MTSTRRRATAFLLCVFTLVGAGLTGCGGGASTTTLSVGVTSSLTEALSALSRRYEESHPGTKLRLVFAGSQELAADLDRPHPVDVLIAADTTTMDVVAKRLTGRRVAVAHNSLTIAVGPGNPKRIKGLADLARRDLRLSLGAPTVPIGRYSRNILARAGVSVQPMLAETGSRSVLTRVRTGEADAGLVYITDLKSAGAAATWVPIPAEQNVTTTYQGAVVEETEHEVACRAFLTWLTTPAAKAVLKTHGFITPDR